MSTYGSSFLIGEVTDINSPYQSGECRVRLYGIEDDKQKIPDSALRWHKVMSPVSAGQTPGSGATHNLQKGSKVIVIFFDQGENQIPVIIGTLSSSGEIKS